MIPVLVELVPEDGEGRALRFVALVFAPHCTFRLRASLTTHSEDPPSFSLATTATDGMLN